MSETSEKSWQTTSPTFPSSTRPVICHALSEMYCCVLDIEVLRLYILLEYRFHENNLTGHYKFHMSMFATCKVHTMYIHMYIH